MTKSIIRIDVFIIRLKTPECENNVNQKNKMFYIVFHSISIQKHKRGEPIFYISILYNNINRPLSNKFSCCVMTFWEKIFIQIILCKICLCYDDTEQNILSADFSFDILQYMLYMSYYNSTGYCILNIIVYGPLWNL